jgi:hypothetical protein
MREKDDNISKVKLTGQNKKKKPSMLKTRPSIQSNYSVVSLSDVTEESLEIWRGLPEEIKSDPSLASFRKKHEKLFGNITVYLFFSNYFLITI